MPELDGIAATRQLAERGTAKTRVLMLTTFDEAQLVYEAMRAGSSRTSSADPHQARRPQLSSPS